MLFAVLQQPLVRDDDSERKDCCDEERDGGTHTSSQRKRAGATVDGVVRDKHRPTHIIVYNVRHDATTPKITAGSSPSESATHAHMQIQRHISAKYPIDTVAKLHTRAISNSLVANSPAVEQRETRVCQRGVAQQQQLPK